MEQTQVLELVKSVTGKISAKWSSSMFTAFNKNSKKDYKEPDYPDYYGTYAIAVELAECNRYHAEKGVFPARLFSAKSPYQTAEELSYIKNNYKQVTLPVAVDFINTISRAFNEGNYSIKYQQDEPKYEKQSLQSYLETEINTFGSLENYFKFLFPTIKTIDANGVIAVKPYFITVKNEKGENVISSTELNEPQPIYYDCSKVVAYKEEAYCLIDVTNYNKKSDGFYYYELYDTENIWLITYDSTKKEKGYTINLYYNHGWGQLPATKVKGLPRQVDGEFMWQSHFSFVTDILDIIAVDNSTLDIATKRCAFPIRVYEGKKCVFQFANKDEDGTISQCNNGKVYDTVLGHDVNCPQCQGIGLVDRFTPMHDFIIEPNGKFDDPTSGTKVPFQYVAPDTKVLEFLENKCARNEEKARKNLHIQNSNAVIKGTENLTATGMALGDKSTSAFIKPISDQMFDVWEFIIDAIGFMRYGEDYKKPIINRPKSFDFNTEFDYMNEVSNASKAGLPPVMIHAIIERYARSHFFKEEATMKALALIIEADLLIGLSNEDIAINMSKGITAGWQKILHDSGITLIRSLVSANPKFFEQKITKQKEDLIAEAKKIELANKPVSNTQNVITSVLS